MPIGTPRFDRIEIKTWKIEWDLTIVNDSPGGVGGELAEPSAPMNDTTEDSYVMQMLTSPAAVVVSSGTHRTVAISPEEIAMRMLDYTVNEMRTTLFARPSIPDSLSHTLSRSIHQFSHVLGEAISR